MMSLSKWMSATAAIVLLAGTSMAADAIYAGKVKSVNADKKEVVLTADGKDSTFKLGDHVVINRGGKESNDLKPDDSVNISYEKGVLGTTWTAHYILVKEGDYKFCELERGAFKSMDADKKTVTISDDSGKDATFATGDTKVSLNGEDSKLEKFKIGDVTLAIVEKVGDKVNLKAVMVDRK